MIVSRLSELLSSAKIGDDLKKTLLPHFGKNGHLVEMVCCLAVSFGLCVFAAVWPSVLLV